MTSVEEQNRPWALPKLGPKIISRNGEKSDKRIDSRTCRKKRKTKKREYKSASELTVSGTSDKSTAADRSTNSASSILPSSTPLDTASNSSRISSSSVGSESRGPLKEVRASRQEEGEQEVVIGSDNESLGFDPVYSHDYESKKQRVLKGKFKEVLKNYFPDLIRSQKMVYSQPFHGEDEEYDTDLEPDLGLELLADERAKRSREDGLCAEYKQRCRKFKVVPNSYFLRHIAEEELRLRYRYLGYGDSATLSHEIHNQPSLTKLDLEDNALGPAGMLCFTEMLKSNAYITEANFAYNNVGVYGARLMKFILVKNVRIVKLNMAGNKFGERGAKYCAIAINLNSTLRELDISHNSISDEGANLISKALANNTGLDVLDMSWNNIGRKGALALAKGLKMNSRLQELNMSMNGCHDEGSKAIISALRYNSTLKTINLSANRIGEEGAKALAKALPYLRLENLLLAFNPLSSDAAEKILRALLNLEEPPLTHLNVEGVVLADDFQLLAEGLDQRGISVQYRIPPSTRERSRDVPLETLSHVVGFLDDVEMDIENLFPNPADGDIIMTIGDLFKHLENSGMFRESTRLMKLKQDALRDLHRRFLIKELFLLNMRRRQSMNEALFTAKAVDNLDLSDSVELLTTERSSFSDNTPSTG